MKKTILLFAFIIGGFVLFAQKQTLTTKVQAQRVELKVQNSAYMQELISTSPQISIANLHNPQRSRGIPASPYPYTKVQPDGTSIELSMRGDGVVHWEETSDGYTVLRNEARYYVYAAKDKYNELVATDIVVNNADNRTQTELEFLASQTKYITYSQNQIDAKIASYYSDERSSKSSAKSFPTTGSRKLIAILVEFPDQSFTRTQSEFDDHFNGANYTLEDATGSVKQYYSDNSFTQLDLNTDVVGPYTLPNNMAYYGGNDSNGDDLAPQEMIEDALALANPDVDFSDYDNDGDGYVDGVYVVFAGYSEASGGPDDAIWPHRWAIWPAPSYDGVDIYDYACSNELYGGSGTSITGIGTVCHEFGHSCGLSDYYDTDYDGSGGQAFTLGSWDVMDGGAYNNYGMTPPFFNSYSRDILNWQTPTVLNSPTSVVMPNIAENNISYYYTTQTSNEYFLLENRQKISWDLFIPHHGMLVYHVDQDYISANGNDFNVDPSYQGFDCVEADNTQTEGSRAGDPFPGTSSNTSFTDATTPSAESYASQNTNKPITSIQEVTQVIYFDFMGGAVSGVPVAEFVADQTAVVVGTTINFTDLSTGVPDNYTWTFGGGTPGASSDSDPSILYDTPGTYSVTLNVSNTHGTNEITKTNYITVTSAPITCEYIDNIDDGDNVVYYTSTGGYLTGINDNNFTEFAEFYDSHTNNLVTGVEMGIAKAESLSSDAKITMKIWDVVAGKPGTELYTEDFDISTFTVSAYNEITFATPTTVPNEFFIGYEIYTTTPQDTFAIYQAENRNPDYTLPVTAYIKYSGNWRDIDDLYGDFNSSFTIAPNVCPAPPVAEFSADLTSGCGSLEVQFTDESSANTDTWSWNFGDGSVSTDQNPSHNFENPGAYTVVLTATNTIGSDVITKTDYIVVGATPGGVVVTGGGTQCGGSMTLTASGGSGGTIYWQNTITGGTSVATASTSESVSANGTYYFRSQSAEGCWGAEGSETITINTVPTAVTVIGGGTQCGGVITLEANGGTGGTIYWQNTTSGGTSTTDASDLEIVSISGTYYFRAQSAEGCWGNEGSADITIHPELTVTMSSTDESAPGANDGSVTFDFIGGTPNYFYNFASLYSETTSATTQIFPDLAGGTYCVTVIDDNGCEVNDCETVNTNGAAPVANFTAGPTTGCDILTVEFTDLSSNAPISWAWTFGDGEISIEQDPYHIYNSPGTYSVTLEATNAVGSNSITMTDYIVVGETPTIDYTVTPASGELTADGGIDVTVTDGTEPYDIVWDHDAMETSLILTDLVSGDYYITVTENDGCEATEHIVVNWVNGILESEFGYSIYPNPTENFLTIEFENEKAENIRIFNVLGELVYTTNTIDTKLVIDVAEFATGTYFVEFQFNGFREVKKLVKQ